jgi:hypothetical protein
MRHILFAATLLAGAMLFVDAAAVVMQRQAMQGHEVSATFNPGIAAPAHAQASVAAVEARK